MVWNPHQLSKFGWWGQNQRGQENMDKNDLGQEVFGDVASLVASTDAVESAKPEVHQLQVSEDKSKEVIALAVHTASGHSHYTYTDDSLTTEMILADGIRQYAEKNDLRLLANTRDGCLLVRNQDLSEGHHCPAYAQVNIKYLGYGLAESKTPCHCCQKYVLRAFKQTAVQTADYRSEL